jgi:small subunit ribosomal protein S16
VGVYDPTPDPAIIEVDREKALKWLKEGAIPSDTVRSFLKCKGIMHEFSLFKQGLNEQQVEVAMQQWEDLQAEKNKKLEAKAAMDKRDEELKQEAEAIQAEEAAKAAAKAEAEAAEAEVVAEEASEEAPVEEATEEPAEEKE